MARLEHQAIKPELESLRLSHQEALDSYRLQYGYVQTIKKHLAEMTDELDRRAGILDKARVRHEAAERAQD